MIPFTAQSQCIACTFFKGTWDCASSWHLFCSVFAPINFMKICVVMQNRWNPKCITWTKISYGTDIASEIEIPVIRLWPAYGVCNAISLLLERVCIGLCLIVVYKFLSVFWGPVYPFRCIRTDIISI